MKCLVEFETLSKNVRSYVAFPPHIQTICAEKYSVDSSSNLRFIIYFFVIYKTNPLKIKILKAVYFLIRKTRI